jgi:hypothetical protein
MIGFEFILAEDSCCGLMGTGAFWRNVLCTSLSVCSLRLKSRLRNDPWSLSSAIWTCDKMFGIFTPLYLETKAGRIRFVMRRFTLFRPTAYLIPVAIVWLVQSFSCRPDFCRHIRRMSRIWWGLGLDGFCKEGIQFHLNLFWRSYYPSVYYTIAEQVYWNVTWSHLPVALVLQIVIVCLFTEYGGRVRGTPAEYSDGPGFKSRPEDWMYWLRFIVFFF